MSSKALEWALAQPVRPASLKLMLIAMANHANHKDRKCFASIKRLVEVTGMDRKTVPGAIDRLCELGMLEETLERRGATGQVKVYLFTFRTGPISEENRPENGLKEARFSQEQARFRATEPNIEPRMEPNKEDSPYGPQGDDVDFDLFGDPILSEEEARQKAREAYIERVSESWAELAATHKNIPAIRKLDDKRRKAVLARHDEHAGAHPDFEPDIWGTVFSNIRNSRFLTGRSRPSPGRTKSFAITLDWLLNPTNFKKVLEGNYHDERGQPDDFDPILGRRLTPIEAAGRSIKERLLQSKERAAGRGTGKPQSFGSLPDLRGS